ncbi:MAG: ABC-type antimicrobial peptide transport system permease subunit [Candidatus Aldehydirespiratoraceae bacterium]|jgi:ABC-type antimicrobial peptide transport system permease subunit
MIAKLIWRNITGKPFRFLLTCSAVTVGVMFTVGVFVFTDGLRSTFDDLAGDIEGNVDYSVRTQLDFGDRDLSAGLIDPDFDNVLQAVPGIAATQPVIQNPFCCAPTDGNGDLQTAATGPNLGLNWEDKRLDSRYFLIEGSEPTEPDQFVLDQDTFENGEFELGGTYSISMPTGPNDYELVGTFFLGAPDRNALVGAIAVAFETSTALSDVYLGFGYYRIDFELEDGADEASVLAAVTAILPDNGELVTGDEILAEREESFGNVVNNFRVFLLVFAFIVLLVSAFVIFNVFTILIGQRIRELGLLRAIGASGRQITWALIGEAGLVGVVAMVAGTGLGIGLGWSLRWLLSILDFGPDSNELVLTPTTFIFGAVVGIGVTMASAIAPALRARRISPMAALREDARLTQYVPPRTLAIGIPFVALAALLIVVAISSDNWQNVIVLGPIAAIANAFGWKRINAIAGQYATLALGLVLLVATLVLDLGTGAVLSLLGVAAATLFLGVNGVSPRLAQPVASFVGRWPLAILLGIMGVVVTLLSLAGFVGVLFLVGVSVKDLITDFDAAGVAALVGCIALFGFVYLVFRVGVRAVDASFIMGWRWTQVLAGIGVFVIGAIGAIAALTGLAAIVAADWGATVTIPIGAVILAAAVWLRRFLPKTLKSNARMARENAGRSPRRTASAAAALMIGLALVSTATVVSSSFKATFADILENSVTADWFISSADNGPNPAFSSELANQIEQLPQVDTAIRFRFLLEAYATDFDGEVRDSSATNMRESLGHLDPDFVELNEDAIARDSIWVHEDFANDNEFTLGSTFVIRFPDQTSEAVRIDGIYSDSSIYGNRVVNLELWADHYPAGQDQFVSVTVNDGVAQEDARAALSAVTDAYPQINLDTRDEFQDRRSAQIDQFLTVISVLLLVAIIIALLGIAITLALSVLERTRELGLVRAVGMTSQQMMRMVLFEGAIIALFGGVLGVALGSVFGAAAVAVIPDDFIRTLDIPVLDMLQYLAIASVAGIGAAIIPARRAARLNVLDAISQG